MDARSIAATARMGGIITAATDMDYAYTPHAYHFDGSATQSGSTTASAKRTVPPR